LSVLGLAARFGSLIAGVMASAPVTDLAGLADVDHRYEAHYTLSLVGPPGAREYLVNSPANQLDQIDVPVMIVHGDADPVVPVEQSRRTVAALRSRGVEVDYHEFVGEGHGLRDRANRLAEFEQMERFAHRVVSGPWPS
jgi:dipeptidyl aminopeptidase/acylaminoacyl peptidase